MLTYNADLTRCTEHGSRPFPRRGLSLQGWSSRSELRKTNPVLGGNSCAPRAVGPGRKNSQKNQSVMTTRETTLSPQPQERQLCLRYITSQTSGWWPRAASSTLLPSASGQSSSKPTAVSMWASLGHTPPLTFPSTPLLGSWTISASDPSHVPTLLSNVKASTWVTPPPQNKVFPYKLLAYTNDKHSGVGATPGFTSLTASAASSTTVSDTAAASRFPLGAEKWLILFHEES